jgi:hypothetical protein
MPYFTQELDIDIDEFLDECTGREIKEVIESLEDRGHIKPNSSLFSNNDNQPNHDVSDWTNMLLKIMDNKHQLTVEEEQLITKISKKLV